MNAAELALHYKDVFSRTRRAVPLPAVAAVKATEPKVVVDAPVFASKEIAASVKPPPLSKEERRQISRLNWINQFMVINPNKVINVILPAPMRAIAMPILAKHGLTSQQAFCRYRAAFVVECRHEIWFALVANGYGYGQLGRIFKRDHTTVMHAINLWRRQNGREFTDYIADPRAVARRLQACGSNIAKFETRNELLACLERLGVLAAGSVGADVHEDGADYVGQLARD